MTQAPKPTEVQQKILEHFLGRDLAPVGCQASAGTGKTTLLTQLFQQLADGGLEPQKILTVTFTRNAAAELETRIGSSFRTPLSIYTIHGFCLWVISRYGYHAGFPLDPVVLTEQDYKLQMTRELQRFYLQLNPAELEPLFKFFTLEQLSSFTFDLCTNELKSYLTQYSAEDAQTLFKSWLTTHLPQKDVLKLLEGLTQYAPDETQFGKALLEIRSEILSNLDRLMHLPSFTFEEVQWLYTLLERIPGRLTKNARESNWGPILKQLFETVDAFPLEVINPTACVQTLEADRHLRQLVAKAGAHLEQYKRTQGRIGFSDLERWAMILVRDFPEISHELRKHFHVVLLDECQDTNESQWNIFKTFLGTDLKGLFAVGDTKQCLYQFRGADPQTFSQMMSEIKDAGGSVLSLIDHFRSSQELLAPINHLAEHLFGLNDAPNLSTSRTVQNSGLFAVDTAHEDDEPLICAQICSQLHQEQGIPYGEMLILLRSLKSQFGKYRLAFQNMQIPLFVDSGHEFYSHPTIRLYRNLLAWTLNTKDNFSLFQVLQSDLFCELSLDKLFEKLPDLSLRQPISLWALIVQTAPQEVVSFLDQCRSMNGETIFHFWNQSPFFQAWIARSAVPSMERLRLKQLNKLFLDFQPQSGHTREESFVRLLDHGWDHDEQSRIPAPRTNAVTLMTVHAAKGLQSRIVLLPQMGLKADSPRMERDLKGSHTYCIRQRLADLSSKDTLFSLRFKEGLARERERESRRIFYVAATRGRDKVFCLRSPDPKPGSWAHTLQESKTKTGSFTFKQEVSTPTKAYPLTLTEEPQKAQPQRSPNLFFPQKRDCSITEVSLKIASSPSTPKKVTAIPLATLFRKRKEGIAAHLKLQHDSHAERKLWETLEGEITLPFDLRKADAFREHPLCFRLGAKRLRGKIDALWVYDGSALIVDYKSKLMLEQIEGMSDHPYRLQLDLYAYALTTHGAAKDVHCLLVDLKSLKTVLWKYDAATLEAFKAKLKELPLS